MNEKREKALPKPGALIKEVLILTIAVFIIAAAVFFALNWALIGGRLYPIGAKALDLSGQGLTGV